jgi:RHS repeat-associated protein
VGCIKEADRSDYEATNAADPNLAQANQDATGDPVNVVTGAFTLTESDIGFPVRRLRVELVRYYNNQLHEPSPAPFRPFGRGWTFSFGQHLLTDADSHTVTFVDDHGAQLAFQPGRQPGTFESPPGGLGLELIALPEGGYELRQIDGLTARFDAEGRLTALVRPGPARDDCINLHYDHMGRLQTVEADCSRGLRYSYQGDSPLVRSVTDHAGRCWRYFYSSIDELVEVRDPAGRIRRYEYETWQGYITDSKGETEPCTISAMHRLYAHTVESTSAPLTPILTNQYTSDRRVYRQTDALGNVTRFDYNRFTRTTYMTDPAGWTTVYCFDRDGNTTKVRRPGGGTTEYVYDERRNLLAEIDPFDNRIEYVEFRDPACLEVAREFGRRAIGNRSDYLIIEPADLRVGYDDQGNRPLIHDAEGNTTRFLEYTHFGRPRRVILPDGTEIRYSYDDCSGQLLRMERTLTAGRSEPLQLIETWAYDDWGNLIRHDERAEDSVGRTGSRRVETFTYDQDGLQALERQSWVEAPGQELKFRAKEHYAWDELGRLVAIEQYQRADPDAEPTKHTRLLGYDILGRVAWVIDPGGTVTCWLRDPEGRVIESFRVTKARPEALLQVPLAQQLDRHQWQYDTCGRELAHIDPTGTTITREWESRGLCAAIREPSGYATRFTYDRDGNLISQTTSSGYSITSSYDVAGRLVAEQDNLGYCSLRKYDRLGRLSALDKGDNGAATTYGYDALARLTQIIYPDGAAERMAYDERNNLIRRERGWQDRPAESTEIYRYDGLGRPIELLAGRPEIPQNLFSIEYDEAAGSVSVRDALGNLTLQKFDSHGLLVHRINADGRVLSHSYDAEGRLLRRWSADRTVAATYEYDPLGRLTAASEGLVSYAWEYDLAGRLRRNNQSVGGQQQSLIYSYDSAGRLTSKQLGDRWRMAFDYDQDSPFVGRIVMPGAAVDLSLDAAGRPTEEHWSDGAVTRYVYAPDGTLCGTDCRNAAGQLIFLQDVTRDSRARPIHDLRRYGNRQICDQYNYDALDRLQSVKRDEGAETREFRRYVYDALGNRLEEHRNGALWATSRYDAANRLVETHHSQSETETAEYDQCGNLLRRGERRFMYDSAGRMRQVVTQSGTTRYDYAPTGERSLITGPGRKENIFFDAGHEALSEIAQGLRSSYWGFQADTLLALSTTAEQTPHRVCTDILGSVITGPSVGGPYEYDPFGDLLSGNAERLLFGFSGKRYDRESSLYYNRARAYDPVSGRFTQPDPLGITDGLNLYQYARSNPVTYVDILGLASEKSAQGSVGSSSRPDVVYRALNAADYASVLAGEGISRPDNRITPTQHIMGVPHPSSWISTTRSLSSATYFATHGGTKEAGPIVAIDLNKVSSPILDVSTRQGAERYLAHPVAQNFAVRYREVLIREYVPQEAIMGFVL